MNQKAGRRWLINALAVLIVLLLLWSCAAFRLGSASASALAFPIKLRSQISADYGPDRLGRPIRSLRFSIVEDTMRDIGLAPEEAKLTQAAFELAMTSPVPTATFAPGLLPPEFTPTQPASSTPTPRPSRTPTARVVDTSTEAPTISPTVTNSRTPTLTRTATETSGSPSKTPTKTRTPTKTKTPSKTSTPGCVADPVAEFRDITPGSTYAYGMELVGEVFAYDPDDLTPPCGTATYDPDNGKGIYKVEFTIEKVGVGQVYSTIQSLVKYCAFTGTSTCTTALIKPGEKWHGTTDYIESGDYIMKARPWDSSTHYGDWVSVAFSIDLTPPSPTPTNTPTPTSTSTPTPTETPTPVCSLITLTGFTTSGKNASWTLTNGNSTPIMLSSYSLAWPAGNTTLKKVKVDGSEIDNPNDNSSPTSAGVNVTFTAGQASELRFEFESDAQSEPYDLTVTFDGGCTATAVIPPT